MRFRLLSIAFVILAIPLPGRAMSKKPVNGRHGGPARGQCLPRRGWQSASAHPLQWPRSRSARAGRGTRGPHPSGIHAAAAATIPEIEDADESPGVVRLEAAQCAQPRIEPLSIARWAHGICRAGTFYFPAFFPIALLPKASGGSCAGTCSSLRRRVSSFCS